MRIHFSLPLRLSFIFPLLFSLTCFGKHVYVTPWKSLENCFTMVFQYSAPKLPPLLLTRSALLRAHHSSISKFSFQYFPTFSCSSQHHVSIYSALSTAFLSHYFLTVLTLLFTLRFFMYQAYTDRGHWMIDLLQFNSVLHRL